jgi:hypothetical protein
VYCRRLLICSAALLMAACSTKKESEPPPRYAVLRFENLTPDPSLNWIGRAASEVLIREIGALPSSSIYAANENFGRRPASAPGVSTEFTDALLAGANHVITGYFEFNRGSLTFHLIEEEARTGKRVRELTAPGPVLDACSALARQITANPKPYATQSQTALQNYAQGLESDDWHANFYQTAVAADPNYSDAYLAWGEMALAHKDADTVAHVLAQAQAHKTDPAAIAKLQFAEATAFNDSAARTSALKRIVETDPTNVKAVQALGEAEMNQHHFAEAAAAFGKGASNAQPGLINLKAYALMFAGDEKGAMDAVHEYQKAVPQDPNSVDSEGDIRYFFGHFAEAEKLYLAADAKDPQFNQMGELWKAARTHLMTGDVAVATQLFNRYREQHEKAKDLTLPLRAAEWQFLTGDRNGALTAMRAVATDARNNGIKNLALTQSAIWELQLGLRADAMKDSETVLKSGQNADLIPAAIVRFSSVEPKSVAEQRARAERSFSGSGGAQISPLAVAYSLIFAKRYADAAPLWKELYEKANPADSTVRGIYALSLEQSGHAAEAASLLKNMPAPAIALAPSFESLYLTPHNTAAPAK